MDTVNNGDVTKETIEDITENNATGKHLFELSECELALILQWIRILDLIKIETVSKKFQQVINLSLKQRKAINIEELGLKDEVTKTDTYNVPLYPLLDRLGPNVTSFDFKLIGYSLQMMPAMNDYLIKKVSQIMPKIRKFGGLNKMTFKYFMDYLKHTQTKIIDFARFDFGERAFRHPTSNYILAELRGAKEVTDDLIELATGDYRIRKLTLAQNARSYGHHLPNQNNEQALAQLVTNCQVHCLKMSVGLHGLVNRIARDQLVSNSLRSLSIAVGRDYDLSSMAQFAPQLEHLYLSFFSLPQNDFQDILRFKNIRSLGLRFTKRFRNITQPVLADLQQEHPHTPSNAQDKILEFVESYKAHAGKLKWLSIQNQADNFKLKITELVRHAVNVETLEIRMKDTENFNANALEMLDKLDTLSIYVHSKQAVDVALLNTNLRKLAVHVDVLSKFDMALEKKITETLKQHNITHPDNQISYRVNEDFPTFRSKYASAKSRPGYGHPYHEAADVMAAMMPHGGGLLFDEIDDDEMIMELA